MADLERHIPMAERLGNDPGDDGRMARSFLAAMARLAEVEAERDELRDSMIAEWNAKRATLAKLARVEAERDEWVAAAKVYANQRDEHKAALARVEALATEWETPGADYFAPGVAHKIRAALRGPQDEACDSEDDWCFTHNRKHFRCYTGRPQDEEAAEVCGANGCSNRATGMRKSYVPGWPDVPDCGQHGSGVSTGPAQVRAPGNSVETPVPWPDEDAARFLNHERAQRADQTQEGDR